MKAKSRPKARPHRAAAGEPAARRATPPQAVKPPAVRAKLVRIGNLRGVRLPKAIIEQAGLTGDVEIAVEENRVVIRPAGGEDLRAGWEEQFKRAIARHGPPESMDPAWEFMPNEFDEKEWTW